MTTKITQHCTPCTTAFVRNSAGELVRGHHRDCDGITRVLDRDRMVIAEGPCPCAAGGHASLRYNTHGDSFSDPPRAVVCRRCGALVADTALHDDFHGVVDPFGCYDDLDHRWHGQGYSNAVHTVSKYECRRCHAVHELTTDRGTGEVITESLVR